jgi:predicted DNA-binding transcriptional regulator AlpA
MSIHSTDSSRNKRRGNSDSIDYVRTLAETAEILGLSLPTLRRMIREGIAPVVTHLSARRMGIRDSHRVAWLNARQSAEKRTAL